MVKDGIATRAPATWKQVWPLAVFSTLLCGLTQNGARSMARVFAGRPLDHGVHAWWMTPLGDSLAIFLLALVLLLLSNWMRWAGKRTVQATVLSFPLFLTVLLLAPRLHTITEVLLAAGLAVRFGAWVPGTALEKQLPRINAGLLFTTLLVALPMALWPMVRARLDHRALADPPAGAPNVLVLLWDTVRAGSLDLYGHTLDTAPFLTRLSRNGVVFDRAFSTSSYTLPSHASLFTGRWSHELSADWRVPLNHEPPTLAEAFTAAGYRTAAFSANRIYVTREFGLGRGFVHFDEHRLGVQQVIRSSTLVRAIASSRQVRNLLSFNDDLARVSASDNHQALRRWLTREPDRPYFAFVNFMEAHSPYLPKPSFAHRFGWYSEGASRTERRKVETIGRRQPERMAPADAIHSRTAYEASISELDAGVNAMLEDLAARGLLENTLIVVTADHGEEFGEHGRFGHGNSLYPSSVHVPLVMVLRGSTPAGVRVKPAVSLRDVPATILDLAGIAGQLPGTSLRTLWENPASMGQSVVFAELRHDPRLPPTSLASLGDLFAVIDDSLQVIRNGDGTLEAFGLANPFGVKLTDTASAHLERFRALMPVARGRQVIGSYSRTGE
jgi:arylsulfatase A-like enzyme